MKQSKMIQLLLKIWIYDKIMRNVFYITGELSETKLEGGGLEAKFYSYEKGGGQKKFQTRDFFHFVSPPPRY